MALTDKAIRATKPQDKDFKLSDETGLYLLVKKHGSRCGASYAGTASNTRL
jgi:hypothetical protein